MKTSVITQEGKSKMQTAEKIVVEVTTDYKQFKLMQGNRNIDWGHVERLKTAMLENPTWFATKPAVVNKGNFVIDGQHRLKAAEQAGLPFYYLVADKMELGAARAMNIRQKQWTMLDYAQSYADSGHKEYEFILQLFRKYSHLALGTIVAIACGSGFGKTSAFKSGNIELRPMEQVIDDTEFIAEISRVTNLHMSVAYTRSLLQAMSHEEFDKERFIRKLSASPESLVQGTLNRDNLRNIEMIFNRDQRESNYTRLF